MNGISMTETTNKRTGEKRYFLDGRRVCRDRYELAEIGAARFDSLSFSSSKTVERFHKCASGDKYAWLPF